jgi:hypothetical protein
MPRFGSQALIVSGRDHLDLEKLCKATPGLLSGLDQVQAGYFILLVSPVRICDEAISNEAHVILKPRPNNRHGPLYAMMQPASYLLADKTTQRRHPTNKRVPQRILLGIDVRLDPQAIAHRGDHTLEQLSPLGLGLEEVLQ